MKKKMFIMLALVMGAMTASAIQDAPDFELSVGETDHGTVSIKVDNTEATSAKEGDVVTVTVTPVEGYVIKETVVSWSAASATARAGIYSPDVLDTTVLTPVEGLDNTYTFTMERANAEVSVAYYRLLTANEVSVLDIQAVTYTGQALKPAVTVKDGSAVLVENTDYTLVFTDNTNAGTATVTVKGAGAYVGEVVKTFTILKANATVTAPVAKTALTYTGQAQTLIKAGSATGGRIQYSLDGETYATALPQGIDAGAYTVYYRVVGDANHNDVTAENFTVTIQPKGTSSVLLVLGQADEYGVPSITVKDGNTELVAGQDYVLTYQDKSGNPVTPEEMGAAPGLYVAVVTLQGNYTGVKQQDILVRKNPVTGISQIEDGRLKIENCYDLSGRRVNKTTKGVYIVNGRKVVIK